MNYDDGKLAAYWEGYHQAFTTSSIETVYNTHDPSIATEKKIRLVGPWSPWIPVTRELQADADAVAEDMKAAAGGKTLTELVADVFRRRKA